MTGKNFYEICFSQLIVMQVHICQLILTFQISFSRKAWEHNLKSKFISWMLSFFSLIFMAFLAFTIVSGTKKFDDILHPYLVRKLK